MIRPKTNTLRSRVLRFATLLAVVGLAVGLARSSTAPPVAEDPRSGARLLAAVRDMALRVARPHESLGPEGMANQMDPYLLGMIEMLRVVDPTSLDALRQALADDTCDNASRDGLDLILLAKLILVEPKLASPRALDCALQRHPTEDFVLWSLLDAYDVTSREPLPSLAAIRKNAKDDRTLRRLAPSREKRLAQAPAVEERRSTRPGVARGEQ